MISPLPGVTAGKPGSAMKALPGVAADVVDDEGKPVANGVGRLPRAHRAVAGDAAHHLGRRRALQGDLLVALRQGCYFAGDGAKKDEDGDLWLLGRVDDVMNVSGHRLSTTEIESALVSHPKVAEAAVVGATDADTGQAVVAFVILRESAPSDGERPATTLVEELRDHVAKEIGPIAKPRRSWSSPSCPRPAPARSCAACSRDVAENRDVGDVTTLADSTVMDLIKEGMATSTED